MKKSRLATKGIKLAATTLLCASTVFLMSKGNSAQAQSVGSYRCGSMTDGTPATVFRKPDGEDLHLIAWRTSYFPGFPPAERCAIVSRKFNLNLARIGHFFIVPGTFNNQRVLCASAVRSPNRAIACTDDQVLMTLRSNDTYNSLIGDLRAASMETSNIPVAHARSIVDDSGSYWSISTGTLLFYAERASASPAQSAPEPVVPSTGGANCTPTGICW